MKPKGPAGLWCITSKLYFMVNFITLVTDIFLRFQIDVTPPSPLNVHKWNMTSYHKIFVKSSWESQGILWFLSYISYPIYPILYFIWNSFPTDVECFICKIKLISNRLEACFPPFVPHNCLFWYKQGLIKWSSTIMAIMGNN